MSHRFNLSTWALEHRTLTLFMLIVLSIAGTLSFLNLGRAEDPPFTIKQMVVSVAWPGATAREMEQQVTDRIETKLQELPYIYNVTSYSRPGEAVIYVNLQDSVPPKEVAGLWYQVRKKVGDIRGSLPQGVLGPFFNDEFGDTYAVIWAFEGDGYAPAEMKALIKKIRLRLLRVPDVAKADIFGAQDERIHLEFSHVRLATLGISMSQLFEALQKQNAMASAGVIETPSSRVALRIDAAPATAQAIGEIPVNVGGRTLRIADVAEVRRGYQDPASFSMRFMGRPALGLGIVMSAGGNMQALGKLLDAQMAAIQDELPVGITVHKVAFQPDVVDRSFSEFIFALIEALGIVLAVSFVSLGLRSGIVVALCVPLVLAITFTAMELMGINFHRISLGALIIALGLLVDDAIIAVEMMMVKLEQGHSRMEAASYAYSSTAFPMLTGTLITAAGFVPVGFARSSAGEYTNAIFWVTAIALVVSWFVAVIFTPFIGYRLLPTPRPHADGHHDPYDRPLYRAFRRAVAWCLDHRWLVIGVTVASFMGSLFAFQFVQKQFFPTANRPELIVDLRLAEQSSYAATEAEVKRLEAWLSHNENVVNYVAYVGGGSPRFYLPTIPELKNPAFGQFVVMSKGLAERERLVAELEALFNTDYPAVRARVQRLQNGPPVQYPVMFRVLGQDPQEIRAVAERVRAVFKADPDTRDINFDWFELSKTVRLDIDHAKARALGVNPQDLSQALHTLLSGTTVTQFREGDELIDVVARAVAPERLGLDNLDGITVRGANGPVPLGQIARLKYELEEPILWRRNKETLMTVRAMVADGVQGPDVTARIDKALAPLRASLPSGYRIEVGGDSEESAKSQGSIFVLMPLMLFLMLGFLMLQLQSFSKLALVFLTAPLGLIGVSLALLVFDSAFGFVSLLGVIALSGMIMRNSVILVDQIDQDMRAGRSAYDAIVEATVRRSRPILLTAAAAIFAMVPLSRSVFWGPMAIALMGGLLVATALTLIFLPALYAAWFRVRRQQPAQEALPVPAPAAVPALAAE
ncbi:MAG: efflux RND transporter permease subunit [Alphaproteobacteria bacterium]|nr:efflux RND transporter permease subunit [Alphaproteobacteria bacterium]MCW5740175.1 efflux RND transporter permease subunit [Alphaproteobacteria bacterium]